MFKKIEQNDISTTEGKIEETIGLKEPALASGINALVENHYTFSQIGVPDAPDSSGSAPYFITLLDAPPTLPWSRKLMSFAYGVLDTVDKYAVIADKDARLKTYRLYAKMLLGNEDAIFKINGTEEKRLYFLSLARNQYKKALIPGAVSISFLDAAIQPNLSTVNSFYDLKADGYNFYGGRAGDLMYVDEVSSGKGGQNLYSYAIPSSSEGLVFYDQGTFVLRPGAVALTGASTAYSGSLDFNACEASGGIKMLHGILGKFYGAQYKCYNNPQITYFKCIAEADEFNYSSNPSFVNQDGQIILTSGSMNNLNLKAATYITTIGLCNDLGEVLAVAKTTEPIKKDFEHKVEINVRLVQ